jgi:hypothetical protein
MPRSTFRCGSFLLALVASLSLTPVAWADHPVPHKESCDGSITSLTPPTATTPGARDLRGPRRGDPHGALHDRRRPRLHP